MRAWLAILLLLPAGSACTLAAPMTAGGFVVFHAQTLEQFTVEVEEPELGGGCELFNRAVILDAGFVWTDEDRTWFREWQGRVAKLPVPAPDRLGGDGTTIYWQHRGIDRQWFGHDLATGEGAPLEVPEEAERSRIVGPFLIGEQGSLETGWTPYVFDLRSLDWALAPGDIEAEDPPARVVAVGDAFLLLEEDQAWSLYALADGTRTPIDRGDGTFETFRLDGWTTWTRDDEAAVLLNLFDGSRTTFDFSPWILADGPVNGWTALGAYTTQPDGQWSFDVSRIGSTGPEASTGGPGPTWTSEEAPAWSAGALLLLVAAALARRRA